MNEAVHVLQPSAPINSAAAPRLGYRGEISDMIERNMTLAEAVIFLRKNWEFRLRLTDTHEISHIVLGLLLHTHPKLMAGKSYQGGYGSEIYVITLQEIIPKHYRPTDRTDKQSFIDHVQNLARSFFVMENRNRVSTWLLAQATGKTLLDVKKAHHHYEYQLEGDELLGPSVEAEASRLAEVTFDEGDGLETITSKKYGVFAIHSERENGTHWQRRKIIVPPGLQGAEPFVPFAIPSRREVGAVFDALLPAVQLLQGKIHLRWEALCNGSLNDCLKPVYAETTVGELITALEGGRSQLALRMQPWRKDGTSPVRRTNHARRDLIL